MKNKILIAFAAIAVFVSSQAVSAQTNQNVNMRSLDGSAVSLDASRGKVVVLAIGATWLPLSREQAKIINQLQQAYGKRGVAVYFVSTESDAAKSKNFATDEQIRGFGERNKLTSGILRDTQGASLKAYGLDQIPSFVVIDKEGNIAGKFSGIDAENDLTAQISAAIDKVM